MNSEVRSVPSDKPKRLTRQQAAAFRRVVAGQYLNGHAHCRTIGALISADLIEPSGGVGYYTLTNKGEALRELLT